MILGGLLRPADVRMIGDLQRMLALLPFRRLQTDTPVLVAGPLKLATKYQADILRSRIMSHIETDWPTTLEAWDEIAYNAVIEPDTSNETSSQAAASDETSSQSSAKESEPQFCPDPVSFISLARECNLPDVMAIVFYSLCPNLTSRPEKLSRMTRADIELLMLGRERMMSFICRPGADQLDISSWVLIDLYSGHALDLGISCGSRGCRYPVMKAWLAIVQDVIRYGDPLATFRASARKLYEETGESSSGYDYCSELYNDEMCIFCKARLSEGLFDLRQTIFDQLPTFFSLTM